jgi:hypothetical protein
MEYALTEKEPGGARPPGSLGGNAQRGLRTATRPTLYRHGEGRSCQVAEFQCYRIKPSNAEALANGRTTPTADIIGRKCRLHL